MGIKDFFNKNKEDDAQSNNQPVLDDDAPQPTEPIVSVSLAEAHYWTAVSAANASMADQIRTGQATEMPVEQQTWFLKNAGKPVNPTEAFGFTWYAHQDNGRMQLVDHGMLVATEMDDPHNMPGIQLLFDPATSASPEALARKDRSEAALREAGVPINDTLPCVEDSASAHIRSEDDVVVRSFCLMAVAIKGEVVNAGTAAEFQPTLQDMIWSLDIEAALTPRELAFVNDTAPELHDAVQFAWRYEGLWTMLWALGFVDTLEYPTNTCNVPFAVGTIHDLGPDDFRAAAKLRSPSELLDAADFIYRLHWAVRNARVGSTPPVENVDSGVVMERHHALNWLIGYLGHDWDDVSTDT